MTNQPAFEKLMAHIIEAAGNDPVMSRLAEAEQAEMVMSIMWTLASSPEAMEAARETIATLSKEMRDATEHAL